jgi:hypothetical protein
MLMLAVVPGEELLTETPGIFNRAEAIRELRSVLESFGVRLGKRVVIGIVGSAVGFGHPQVGQ